MEIRRDVFQAIADPTRRQIIELLASGPLNLNAVAENFEISRPAISKHIKILIECGLVSIRQQGRERYCNAQFDRLKEVADWTGFYNKLWDKKLNALQKYFSKEKSRSKKRSKQISQPFSGNDN